MNELDGSDRCDGDRYELGPTPTDGSGSGARRVGRWLGLKEPGPHTTPRPGRGRGYQAGQERPLAPHHHPSGQLAPRLETVPQHVAIVMDGNGRWANQRGLSRNAGHTQGEATLFEVVAGAVEIGVKYLSVYAFSTENWRRSPEEVRFLMGYNRQVLRNRREQMHDWGVRMRWVGRKPKLWGSVLTELAAAEERTRDNTVMTLAMCINYGGRAEIADAAREIATLAATGRLDPKRVDERTIARHLDEPDMPDVDLFLRSSGEQRISNFLLWQSAYAELAFVDTLWPDFSRLDLWRACEAYASRDRRYGGAVDKPRPSSEEN